jgi:hypothetical protein
MLENVAKHQKCTHVADSVVPKYRSGAGYSCGGIMAKRWQAAWDAAWVVLGYPPSTEGDRHPYLDFNKAINFAVDEARHGADIFLRSWREGDWATLDAEWPEWKAYVEAPDHGAQNA